MRYQTRERLTDAVPGTKPATPRCLRILIMQVWLISRMSPWVKWEFLVYLCRSWSFDEVRCHVGIQHCAGRRVGIEVRLEVCHQIPEVGLRQQLKYLFS